MARTGADFKRPSNTADMEDLTKLKKENMHYVKFSLRLFLLMFGNASIRNVLSGPALMCDVFLAVAQITILFISNVLEL